MEPEGSLPRSQELSTCTYPYGDGNNLASGETANSSCECSSKERETAFMTSLSEIA
jgi:hypothetical protein